MRYFSRGHRCIAYSARGYTPSDVPPAADVYTYKHFYMDALAVLDHLEIAKAHFIGLSMGSYSSLQVGLNAPERALSMTLAAVGSGSPIDKLDAFRAQCRANAEQYEAIGSVEVAKETREAPSRIPFLLKDPRGHGDFYAALARHDAKGSANTMRSFQGGRPSIYTMVDAIRKVPTPALILCGDEARKQAMCSIWRSRRCSTRWWSASSRSWKPAAGRCAIHARWRTRRSRPRQWRANGSRERATGWLLAMTVEAISPY
jgi:proline iminopeptidase